MTASGDPVPGSATTLGYPTDRSAHANGDALDFGRRGGQTDCASIDGSADASGSV